MANLRTPSTGSDEKMGAASGAEYTEKHADHIHGAHTYADDDRDPEAKLGDMHHDLHRGLKARHITMIAIGGAVGTGLLIGT